MISERAVVALLQHLGILLSWFKEGEGDMERTDAGFLSYDEGLLLDFDIQKLAHADFRGMFWPFSPSQ